MTEGWIKLHRSLSEDPQWLKEPFTRGQAWVDLLMLANHQDGYIRARGHRVEVKRGQVGWSAVALAHRWRWSRDRVRRYLKELQEIDHQVIHQTDNFSSIITIVKYEIYQSTNTANKTAKKQQTIQQTDSKQVTNKNVKNEKNEKKKDYSDIPLPSDIDPNIWKEFLHMRDKLKSPPTDYAKYLIYLELDKIGQNKNEVLNQSIKKNWKDVFPLKENQQPAPVPTPAPVHRTTRQDEEEWEAQLKKGVL